MFVTQNAVYLDIPKTGSRTVQQTLSDHFGGQPLPDHVLRIPSKYSRLFAFTVVRNPYDRACSLWWSTCQRSVARKGYATKMEILGLDNKLESFLLALESVWGDGKDVGYRFARPQTDYTQLNTFGAIIKHEELEEGFNKLPFVRHPIVLEHLNSTRDVWKMNPSARPPWSELKTDECVRLINKLYKSDFDQFGYEYE